MSFILPVLFHNTAVYVGFQKPSYVVLESERMVTLCLTVDRGGGMEELQVSFSTTDLTTQGFAYTQNLNSDHHKINS